MGKWLPIVIFLLWIGASALIFYAWAKRRKARALEAAAKEQGKDPIKECASHGGTCCGLHAICERGLPKHPDDIYFDDEELDRFAGRGAEEYTPEEVEEFREIMMTTLPEELGMWARCLGRRGITLPSAVRDEMLLLMKELE